MDKATIETQHLVDRYVQGKLSSEEQREFEIFMLDNPDIADQVEYARGMQSALQDETSQLFADIDTGQRKTGRQTFFQSPTWAMAATVLLGASIAWNVAREWQEPSVGQPLPVTQEVWLEPARSEDSTYEIAADPAGVLVNIDVAATPATAYRVDLLDAGGATVWSFEPALADDDQLLRLVAPPFPANDSTYTVVVYDAERASEPLTTYSLALTSATDE
ncbi:MAG: hypothetical protein AAGC71_00350 [Pseudomonadota bacterium]